MRVIHRLIHRLIHRNKVTERKKTEIVTIGKAGLEGNWNYPLSIEGVVPLFRSPCRAFSCRLTYPHKPFRV